jgi:predicted DNA-binding protein (MmcQ/YjbR family)
MPPSPLARIRKLCFGLPGGHEVEAWGEPTFRVNNKIFAMYASANNHHGAGHHSIWVKATPTNQGFMVRAKPTRFFVPPYVGAGGWIGVRLDGRVNWREVGELLQDAYDLTIVNKKRG